MPQVRMYYNLVPLVVREIPTDITGVCMLHLTQPSSEVPIQVVLPPCHDGVFAEVFEGDRKLGHLQLQSDDVRVMDANDDEVDMFPLRNLAYSRWELMVKVVPNPGETLVPRVSAAMIGAAILMHENTTQPA